MLISPCSGRAELKQRPVLLVRPVQSSLCWILSSSLGKGLNFSRLKFPAQRTSVCWVQTCVFRMLAEFRHFSFLWTVRHNCYDWICHQMQSIFIHLLEYYRQGSSVLISLHLKDLPYSIENISVCITFSIPQQCIREEERKTYPRITVLESKGSRARTDLM